MSNSLLPGPLDSRPKSNNDSFSPTLAPMSPTNTTSNNNDIKSLKNIPSSNTEKTDANPCKNDIMMVKRPEIHALMENERKTLRKIQVDTVTVIVNKRITTPATLKVRPSKGSYNLNVSQSYLKTFSTMKINDPTLKIITSQNKSLLTQFYNS